MPLLFLSDTADLSTTLRDRVADELANRGGRIAYISSAPQDADRGFFHGARREYASILPSVELSYFDLSPSFTDEDLARILDFQIVHLSGGNTYAFLEASRERELKTILERHRERGGLIIGVSAGAILMTPDIGTSAFCGDRNMSSLRDTTGFNFVEFLFLPHLGTHFLPTTANLHALNQYAARLQREVYVSEDSDGIFIDDAGRMTVYGKPLIVPSACAKA
ncbi:MAG TPA: Type 1 glutamine amidotransferase-like domain-containing protein [Candidatus Baltobacteraceae bacterium]|nr:Type 1 glutamine amidotransferase-like domain-containing protein [Candidatus Baltobacteraceae bacterium]